MSVVSFILTFDCEIGVNYTPDSSFGGHRGSSHSCKGQDERSAYKFERESHHAKHCNVFVSSNICGNLEITRLPEFCLAKFLAESIVVTLARGPQGPIT
jgi:hypothetical protein